MAANLTPNQTKEIHILFQNLNKKNTTTIKIRTRIINNNSKRIL